LYIALHNTNNKPHLPDETLRTQQASRSRACRPVMLLGQSMARSDAACPTLWVARRWLIARTRSVKSHNPGIACKENRCCGWVYESESLGSRLENFLQSPPRTHVYFVQNALSYITGTAGDQNASACITFLRTALNNGSRSTAAWAYFYLPPYDRRRVCSREPNTHTLREREREGGWDETDGWDPTALWRTGSFSMPLISCWSGPLTVSIFCNISITLYSAFIPRCFGLSLKWWTKNLIHW
jgi:hypothetical protein